MREASKSAASPSESIRFIRAYLDSVSADTRVEAAWSAPLDHATAGYLSFLKHAIVYSTVLLYAYDYICTLDREVKLIWSRPRSAGTYLFVLCRYLPFVDLCVAISALHVHEPKACYRRYSSIAILNTVGITLTQLILCLRTLALWRRQRWVRVCLPLAGLTSFTFTVIVLHFFIGSLEFVPSANGHDCNLARASKLVIAPYLSVVCYETLIVVLTIIKAIEHVPASQFVRAADWTWVHQFYHRGVIFYVLTLCVSIVNVVYPFIASPGMRSLFTDLQRAMHSMLCTRVIFVICSLQRRDDRARAAAAARQERKQPRMRNKIRKHCKFNSSTSTSNTSPSGFIAASASASSPKPQLCRDPSSDSDSDAGYNSEYAIDLDFSDDLNCERSGRPYRQQYRGEMEFEDGPGDGRRNGAWRGWQQSTGVITTVLDTYVTNEDTYAYSHAVYDEDTERGRRKEIMGRGGDDNAKSGPAGGDNGRGRHADAGNDHRQGSGLQKHIRLQG